MRIWWADFRQDLSRHLVCPVVGHHWRPKMYGAVCRRCSIWRP